MNPQQTGDQQGLPSNHSSERSSGARASTTSSLDLFASSGELSNATNASILCCSHHEETISTWNQESSASARKKFEAESVEEVYCTVPATKRQSSVEELPMKVASSGTLGHYPTGKRWRLVAKNLTCDEHSDEFSMCKWSPDGKILLASGIGACSQLYSLPSELESAAPRSPLLLAPSRRIHHGEPVQDACWMPSRPKFFATCCLDHPVQLWDRDSGVIHATYTTYHRKHKEKAIAPYCIAFSEDSQSLYCGLDSHLKVFATGQPGIAGRMWKISGFPTSPLSSIALFSSILALGFRNTICICSEVNGGTLKLNIPGCGVTQMEFSCNGTKLFCTYRMTNVLDCWDLRQTSQPLYSINRSGNTKQRVYFDFLSNGHYLVSGGVAGIVSVWDLQEQSQSRGRNPRQCHLAHTAPTLGCSAHPSYPLLATVSRAHDFINECREPNVVKVWSTLGPASGTFQNLYS